MPTSVPKIHSEKFLQTTKVGFYLGSMSGPGSGAWTWFIALLKELSLRPEIHVTVFGPLEYSDEIAKLTGVKYEALPHRYLSKVKRISPIVHKIVFDHKLVALHFLTLPVPSKVQCQVFYTLHDLRSHYPKKIGGGTWRDVPRKTALRFIRSKVDYVVTTSEWSKQDITKKLKVPSAKILVIPQILELKKLYRLKKQTRAAEIQRYVLALGHIELRKNLRVLVKASQSDFWPKNVELRIVGRDLGELQDLKNLYSRNIKNIVHFQSHVSEQEKWKLINGATVIAVPSLIEGYGILTAEGVSSGIPVIVSDQSALPEVIGVEEAIIPAHEFDRWATTINRLCSDQKYHDMIVDMELKHLQMLQSNDFVSDLIATYLGNSRW